MLLLTRKVTQIPITMKIIALIKITECNCSIN